MDQKYKAQIFISYSHLDEICKDKLEKKLDVLQRQGNYDVWTDREIGEGDKWLPAIEEKLNSCDVAILLISDNFLTSDFIMDKEVPLFLNRREKHGLKIYPLIIDDCPWKKVPWLAELAGALKDNVPLREDEKLINKKLNNLVTRVDDYCQTCHIEPKKETNYKKPFNVPFGSKQDGAIGIEEKLDEVHTVLQNPNSRKANIGQVATFQGMGGLGKTQLAVEYVYRYKDEYDGIVWLTVDQDTDRQIVELAENMGWISKEMDAKIKLDISKEHYENLENMLLVYDNVEEYDDEVAPLIPKANNNKILITSRTNIGDFTSIELATLSEDNSLKLLEFESQREVKEHETKSVNALIQELDGLPLAVEMAGAYMLNAELDWNEYWQLFQNQKVTFLEKSTIRGSATNHENNIGKTLAIGESIFDKTPLLREIIHLLTFGASEPMNKKLLSQMLDVKEFEVAEALQDGIKLKYIKKEDEDGLLSYTLHRLVREVWKSKQTLDESFTQKVSENLALYLKEIKDEFLNFNQIEMASFHAKKWTTHLQNSDTKALLLGYSAYPDYYMGEYDHALDLVGSAYDIVNKEIVSIEYAEILTYNASILNSLGKSEEALPYYKKALEMRREIYGERNHPDIANSLGNMGYILNSLGKSEDALPYYKKH